MEEPIAGTSPGWTETMTDVAVLPTLDWASGLRYLAARMRMFLELRIDSARQGNSVTGALCRKTDPKIATAPKTQSRSKDQNKDKDNSK